MAKLLNHSDSFTWENKDINRSSYLQNYNAAVDEARTIKDDIFCSEQMFNASNKDNIFLFMWTNGYLEYEQLSEHFKWLTPDDFQVLNSLQNNLGRPTPNSSDTWQDFSNEFAGQNVSLIGLRNNAIVDPLVHDIASLYELHQNYVASFDFETQISQFGYFKKHYRPSLKINQNQIATQIARGKVHAGIIRIDPPKCDANGSPLHGQKIHVHFKVESVEYALNIDGSWKHPSQGPKTRIITREICETLAAWGFCLPDQYYLKEE